MVRHDPSAAVYLGVDGGGTKTALCLVAADGHVIAASSAPSAYSTTDPVGAARSVLAGAVPELCAAGGVGPGGLAGAFLGLPAHGEVVRLVAAVDAAVREVLAPWTAGGARDAVERVGVDNDMVCGWAGSLALADGINVIAGTGSMAYGQRAGARARVGGWGELFGDEGSAHWLGLQGLGAFSRMSDGRLPDGPLHDLVAGHLGIAQDLDAIDLVLGRWGSDRSKVAGVARAVDAAALAGDTVAADLVERAGAHLADLVGAARRRLGFADGEVVPVSTSGGVFSSEGVRGAFERALADLGDVELRAPRFSPVVGAALHAAAVAGAPLDEAALAHLAGA